MEDLLDGSHDFQSQETINEHCTINMNFLEYYSLKLKLNDFLEYQDTPDFMSFTLEITQ